MEQFIKDMVDLPCRVVIKDAAVYMAANKIDELSAIVKRGFSYTAEILTDEDTSGVPKLSIVILSDFFEAIPKEEVKAILYHEAAHIVHCHMVRSVHLDVMPSLECELMADAYAAERTSPETMYSAIISIASFRAHVLAGLVEEVHIKEETARKLSCPILAARLKALKGMFRNDDL